MTVTKKLYTVTHICNNGTVSSVPVPGKSKESRVKLLLSRVLRIRNIISIRSMVVHSKLQSPHVRVEQRKKSP